MGTEALSWDKLAQAHLRQAESNRDLGLHFDIVNCPTCGAISRFKEEGEETTLGWFPFKKDGRVHLHDPNRRLATYRCAAPEHHVFIIDVPLRCPTCRWKRGDD